MKPADIARTRLGTQGLRQPRSRTAAEVVRALGAVQAQDYDGAKWALSQRTRGGLADTAIEREVAEGKILRTHVLRPTWHFVAPEDIRWMLALTAPRVSQFMAYHSRSLELTPAVFRRSNAVIARALEGGNHLTRAELGKRLEKSGVGPAAGQRLAGMMMQAELDAVLCSGPRRGKQFTYALLDERAPNGVSRDRDDALRELTRLYFRTRGPATLRDFAWWSGLAMADVKRGVEIAARELERVVIGEQTYWRHVEAKAARKSRPTAHLLPSYDEYFIGFKDRSAIAQRLGSATILTGGSALIGHVVVVDGQIVGGWRRKLDGKDVTVTLKLLTRLTPREKKLVSDAAKGFRRFQGQPLHPEVRSKGTE